MEVVEKGSVVWWCEVVGDGRVIAFQGGVSDDNLSGLGTVEH